MARLLSITCLVLLAVCGCARYQPRPLTSEAVQRKLDLPSGDRVAVLASELRHPLLKPLLIDLSGAISPDQAAVLAVILHPDLRGERDARKLAAAQLLQAGLLPNPQFVAGVDFPHGSS